MRDQPPGNWSRAIARAALAQGRSRPARRRRTPSRGIRCAGPGRSPRRVAVLLAPAPGPQSLLLVAALAVVAVAGLSALEAARDLNALLELAGAA